MTEKYRATISLDYLTTLEIIAEFLKEVPDSTAEALKQISIQFRDGSPLTVRLLFPEGKPLPKNIQDGCKELERYYTRQTQAVLDVVELTNVYPLLPNIVNLLTGSDTAALPITYQGSEQLVLANNIDEVQAEQFLYVLRGESVDFNISYAQSSKDNDHGFTYVYHLKNDASRGSNFDTALLNGYFPDTIVTTGYNYSAHKLFLSPTISPGQSALTAFFECLIAQPKLFGGSKINDHGILAAVHQQPDDATNYHLVWIGDLTFHNKWVYIPTPKIRATEFVSLQDSAKAAAALRQRIEQVKPKRGYELRLVPSQYRNVTEAQIQLLQERLQAIEEQLGELDNRQKRPILLRFTTPQLPVLADKLRSYQNKQLKDIKYAYSAPTEKYRDGLHFLYIPPQVEASEPDPIIWWGDQWGGLLELAGDPEYPPPSQMRFWLDPLWANHYYQELPADPKPDETDKAYLFVPWGMRITPAFHSWNIDEMTVYLRSIVGKWFKDRFGIDTIPQHGWLLYLFDGDGQNDIDITVVDLKEFVPLEHPDVLGWLNDNLSLLDADPNTRSAVEALAKDKSWTDIRHQIEQKTEHAVEAFIERGRQMRTEIDQDLQELLADLNLEIAELIELTGKKTDEAHELNKRLNEIQAEHQQTLKVVKDTEQQRNKAEQELSNLDTFDKNLPGQVAEKMRAAKGNKDNEIKKVAESVTQLRNLNMQLRDQIATLRKSLSGEQ